MCVQSVDVQCALQFTLFHAVGCVLHRPTSRVIHRPKLSKVWHVGFLRGAFFGRPAATSVLKRDMDKQYYSLETAREPRRPPPRVEVAGSVAPGRIRGQHRDRADEEGVGLRSRKWHAQDTRNGRMPQSRGNQPANELRTDRGVNLRTPRGRPGVRGKRKIRVWLPRGRHASSVFTAKPGNPRGFSSPKGRLAPSRRPRGLTSLMV